MLLVSFAMKITQLKLFNLKNKSMNYSTIKTAVACSLVAVFGATEVAQAQEPAVFGGRSQYRTWSIGVNGGFTTPSVLVGGSNAFSQKVGFGEYKLREYYGLTVRKQFSNWFGLEAAANRGRIFAHNNNGLETYIDQAYSTNAFQSAETSVQYAASLNGVFQLATIDFLRRENAVNFYASVGYGVMAFNPVLYTDADGSAGAWDNKGNWGEEFPGERAEVHSRDFKREAYIPVGVGFKFKLSDRVALNLGYTMNFVDDKSLFGPHATNAGQAHKSNDKFSYTYGGLEFSLGSSSKADLTWHNPVSTLYDELRDPALRGEVEALKQRVSTLEGLVDDLSRDSDGDGVSDKFDKCPGTPAGVQVDGAGCPINFPEPQEQVAAGTYPNIQFEFDSSVLKTESYSILDRLSAELRKSGGSVRLEGYASAEGSEAYNLQLSKDRANSVKTYLVNSGVAAAKIQAEGFGESNPVASNATEAGRILNRRVEIKN